MELWNGMEPFPKLILSWELTVHSLATVVGMAASETQVEAVSEKATSEFFSQPAPAR